MQIVTGRISPRRTPLRHKVIKLTKKKILKAAREKQQITPKRSPIRLLADFSTEALQARRNGYNIFKVMKGKNLQPRISNKDHNSDLAEKSKALQTEQKVRGFRTIRPVFNKW